VVTELLDGRRHPLGGHAQQLPVLLPGAEEVIAQALLVLRLTDSGVALGIVTEPSRVLGLTLQLVHEQFGLSWPRAIQASYYTTRAAVAWAPADHNVERVRHYLRHFYRTVRRADADHIGDRELDYWILHRDLSGRPQSRKEPLERSLADLHAALFGLPREATAESGVARARAADAVDETTSGRAQDVAGDWARVERHLRDCYRSISRQLE